MLHRYTATHRRFPFVNQTFGRSEAVAKLVETVHFRYTTGSLLTPPTTPSQPRPPNHALRQHPLVRWTKRTETSAPAHRIRGSQAKQRLLVYSTAAASVTASLSPPPAAPSAAGAGSDRLAPMRPRRGPIRQLVAIAPLPGNVGAGLAAAPPWGPGSRPARPVSAGAVAPVGGASRGAPTCSAALIPT